MSSNFSKIFIPNAVMELLPYYFQITDDDSIYGNKVCLKTEREKIDQFEATRDDSFLITVHPTYGIPGSMAFNIWLWLNNQLKYYKEPFQYTAGGLIKAMDMSKSSKTIREVVIALHQLQFTTIHYCTLDFLKLRDRDRENDSFSFLHVKHKPRAKNLGDLYTITPDPVLLDIYQNRRFKYHTYNFERIKGGKGAQHKLFLLVLYYHLNKMVKAAGKNLSANTHYHCSYENFCDQWLGGRKPKELYRAYQHHLHWRVELGVQAGLITSDSNLYPPMRNGKPVANTDKRNVRFYPTRVFFSEYEYLQPVKKTKTLDEDIITLFNHFSMKYQGDTNRDIEGSDKYTAKDLIAKYGGLEQAKEYVTFATDCVKNWRGIISMAAINRPIYHKQFAQLPKNKAMPVKRKITQEDRAEYKSYYINTARKIFDEIDGDIKNEIQTAAVNELKASAGDPNARTEYEIIGHMIEIYRLGTLPAFDQWLKIKECHSQATTTC